MRKGLKIFILIFLAAALGFARESLFVHLNAQIDIINQGYNQVQFPRCWSFMENMSVEKLQLLKWVFTILFFIIFWAYTLLVVHLFFRQKRHYAYTHILYATTFFIGFFAILLGKLAPSLYDACYTFSRIVIGGGQSPLFTIMLIPVFWLGRNNS